MLKDYSKKRVINRILKILMKCSFLICCIIVLLVQTAVFAYQSIEINPVGLTFTISDEFTVIKNMNYINGDFEDEYEGLLETENLYFLANSFTKNMSIQIRKAGESEYATINSLDDSKILKLMEDYGFVDVAKDIMIENSLKISLQTNNGQKYYMIRGYCKDEPDYFLEYAVTINNGYIVWCQIFHYDTYSQKNTCELLDSFEFTENTTSFSNTTKLKNEKKDMRNDAFAKGVIESVVWCLIFGCFFLIKKIWTRIFRKKTDNTSFSGKEDISSKNENEVAQHKKTKENERIYICQNCSAFVQENSKFCHKCGTGITKEEQ